MKRSEKPKESRAEKKARRAMEKATKKAPQPVERVPLPPSPPPRLPPSEASLQTDPKIEMDNRKSAKAGPSYQWDNRILSRKVDVRYEPEAVVTDKVTSQLNTDQSGFDFSNPQVAEAIEQGIKLDGPQLAGTSLPDPNLWQGLRVMVPVDVQALVVPESAPDQDWADLETKWETEPNPPQTASSASESELWAAHPDPFEKKQPTKDSLNPSNARKPGIHLHWAMPDALMRGSVISEDGENEYLNLDDYICVDCGHSWPSGGAAVCSECSSSNPPILAEDAAKSDMEVPHETDEDKKKNLNQLFTFPQLPNRWLVVRTWPKSDPTLEWNSKAWVIESESLSVHPLSGWSPTASAGPTDEMTAIGPHSGDLNWTVTYDNSEGRFTFHDTPASHVSGPLNYFVSGWYDNKVDDPLWCSAGYPQSKWWERLEEFGWSLDKDALIAKVDEEMEEAGTGIASFIYGIKSGIGGDIK